MKLINESCTIAKYAKNCEKPSKYINGYMYVFAVRLCTE